MGTMETIESRSSLVQECIVSERAEGLKDCKSGKVYKNTQLGHSCVVNINRLEGAREWENSVKKILK